MSMTETGINVFWEKFLVRFYKNYKKKSILGKYVTELNIYVQILVWSLDIKGIKREGCQPILWPFYTKEHIRKENISFLSH